MRYRVIGYAFLFLFLGETALEVRANRRGWDTLLFGSLRSSQGAMRQDPARDGFGPSPAFPFRSEQIDDPDVRLWIASASYAEDATLPAATIFPNLLRAELDTIARVEVLNAARSGYGIEDNLDRLSTLGPRWRPDVVVLYAMSLDIDALARQLLTEPASGEGSPSHGLRSLTTGIRQLSEETTAYSLLKANLTAIVSDQKILAQELPATVEDSFAVLLDRFVGSVQALGATPVLTTFAVRTPYPRPLTLEDRKFVLRWDPYVTPEAWIRTVDRLNNVVRRFARERGVELIDVAAGVSGEIQWFRDLVHFSPAGHREMARVLSRGLEPVVRYVLTTGATAQAALGETAP